MRFSSHVDPALALLKILALASRSVEAGRVKPVRDAFAHIRRRSMGQVSTQFESDSVPK